MTRRDRPAHSDVGNADCRFGGSSLPERFEMSEANTEYCLQYRHGGKLWALNFFAVDDADAARKVQSLRESLELLGPLMGRGDTLEEAAQAAATTEAASLLRRVASPRALRLWRSRHQP